MKLLLLSVALLFFTGAHGRYFWQQDEPHQEAESDALQKIFTDGIAMITDMAKNFDSSEIAKEYHIKEKMEAAKKHAEKLENAVEAYYKAVFKKFDEQLHEKFPTFRDKVVPILKQFDDTLEEHMKKILKELVPVGSDFIVGVSKQIIDLTESLEVMAEKVRDKLRTDVDDLRVKLQPYVGDVHAEYEKYYKESKDALEKDYRELRQKAEKNMEAIREHAKPHIENLKSKIPDGKELQAKLEALLNKIKEALKEDK